MDEQEVTTERCENHGLMGTGTIRAERLVEDSGECCAERDEPLAIPKQKNQIRDVSIKQLNFGYIVKIGCHSFALETHEKLIEKLGEYLKDPDGTERKWYKGELL